MYLGLFLTAPTVMGFGFLYWVPDDTVFISLAITLRFIGGIGQGFIAVSSYAMAAVRYKENLQEKVGLLEAGNGVGFLVGPVVGGIIYEYTHFAVPFIVFGIAIIILTIFLRNQLDEDLDTIPLVKEDGLKVGFRYLMRNKRVFFAALWQFFTLSVLTFGQPIFGQRLEKDYGFSFATIGLCFALPTLAYALTGPLLLKRITKHFEYRTTIMMGFWILVVSGIFIGPSKVFQLPGTSPVLMLIGLYLLGTGVAWTIIPIIPEMMQSIDQDERAYDKVSAIFNIFGGFGQIVAPPLAGALNDHIGFNYSLDVLSFAVLIFLIVYFIYGNGYEALKVSCANSCTKIENSLPISSLATGLDIPHQKQSDDSDLDYEFKKAENNGSMVADNEDTIELDDENNDKIKYLGVDSNE
jgi:MFS family permease